MINLRRWMKKEQTQKQYTMYLTEFKITCEIVSEVHVKAQYSRHCTIIDVHH